MASTLNPYLHFRDDARAAMEFYQSILGGDLTVTTFGELGADSGPDADLVMHAQLRTPHGFTLMGSDTPSQMEWSAPRGFRISISGDDAEDIRRWFSALGEGGEVTMPLEKQVWGDEFGMLTDRYGVEWMLDIEARP